MKNIIYQSKRMALMLVLFASVTQLYAGAPKEKLQEYCPVHGIYTRFVDSNGQVVHVCAFISDKQVCFLMLCNEMLEVKKVQTQMPVKFPTPEGKKAILIPVNGGYEVIYYDQLNVLQNDLKSVSFQLQ